MCFIFWIHSFWYWSSKVMKLDKLNLDCLESVLEHLRLIDLLNVADSTNKAAELVYARKYRSKIVWPDNIRISSHRLFRISRKMILIKDLKTALQLIRCCGRAVWHLESLFWVSGSDGRRLLKANAQRSATIHVY